MQPITPLPPMSGIPRIPREAIPHEIGTEVYYLADGKIFTGLIRVFNSEDLLPSELIVQSGHSTTRLIKYDNIIGVNPPKEIKHEYSLSVSVSIIELEDNRKLINCVSNSIENINGIIFYSSKKNDEKYWEKRKDNYVGLNIVKNEIVLI